MPDTTIAALNQTMSTEAMMRDLEAFALRVKLSGTADELASFQYIQGRLQDCGFQTQLLSHNAYISLPGKAGLRVGNEQIACITHSFSRASPAGGTRGELVYLGAGAPADFAAIDVRGKVAVMDGIANPAASLRASQAGAIGQLHVSPHDHKHEMCISPVWGSPNADTLANLPTTVVLSVAQADGERLKRRLAAEEAVTATLEAEVDTGWRPTPILVAELYPDAAGPDAPFVMFSGHHDTWHYGVMDNGTANATMMEVARLCASQRHLWRRGLRLCFWSGHSHGRYSGSAWYADQHWDELERRCVAHVNIDSTGGKGATVLTDVLTSAELRGLGGAAVKAQAGQDIIGLRMSRAGDQSFWGIGVPSIFMGMSEQPVETTVNLTGSVLGGGGQRKGAGFGWWWHTPDDTLDKIDPDFLRRDAQVYVQTLWHLLHDAVLPLDYRQWVADFTAELAHIAGKINFDLSPLRHRAATLATAVAALQAANTPAINPGLMRLSRALVPIDYTSGDRFDHDPALGLSPWPPLDPIRRLAGLEGDDAKFQSVAAIRARNRIAHALDQAIAAAQDTLARL